MDERIIDTCCLLNLFASGEPKAICQYFGGLYISEQVQGESLLIRQYDNESPPQLVAKQLDLTECIDSGAIAICQLEQPHELELFVRLAQQLDDGEASVLAIAKTRGWIVATDDKKAQRVALEQSIPTKSTSELIQAWAASENMSDRQIGEILRNIRQFGRFVPRRSDPLYEWWMQMVEAAGA